MYPNIQKHIVNIRVCTYINTLSFFRLCTTSLLPAQAANTYNFLWANLERLLSYVSTYYLTWTNKSKVKLVKA